MGSFWIILSILIVGITSNAHQAHEGTVLGTIGPFFHQTHSLRSKNPAYSPPLAGIGFLAEGDLYDRGGIEIGLFYTHKTYQRSSGNAFMVEKVHKISVPIGYRHWLSDIFSMGFFFNSMFSNGEPQTIYNDIATGEITSAREMVESGIEYSIQWEVWTNEKIATILDGRYCYSLSTKPNEDAHQYGILFGVKYMIQEK
ncbi:MAG: hypothetical protein SGI74_04340 [Oligoflexia bacterium]|nr:hypothetical protein [Oligoflexia bacterium]